MRFFKFQFNVSLKVFYPIILIFIPLPVSATDSLLTFSIHEGGGWATGPGMKNVE